ncbi:MAG: class I SAM-dependent methyltransferase [Bacteroidetes bacterium]|nr:class I SAM-dependent methyltransferase [Bacteroidota bacterium]
MSLFNPRKIFYALGPRARFLARRLYYLPTDIMDRLSGKRDALTPPKGLIYTGSGNFGKIGEHLVKLCKKYADLKPDHKVLDIGSGIGRVAVPLTRFLSKDGGYEGFDVMKTGVSWCQRNISSRFPNFRFTYTPLKNDLYRSDGSNAENFAFPYEDAVFDLTVSNSVYTHMLPEEVANYLRECTRVLKKGGMCYATFFILDAESREGMKAVPDFSFPHAYEGYSLMDDKVKRANVAFDKDFLYNMIRESGLEVVKMLPGFWPNRDKESCEEFQDVLILRK